jgi:acyl-CoA synthetase (AMP-forming)/AMP-acid ligase II
LKYIFINGDTVPAGCISVKEMRQNPLEKKYPEGYLKKFTYDPREVSWISHTSGSTGFPKFVEIPAVARRSLCEGQCHVLKLSRNDVIGALSPATGGPNIIAYWSAAMAGARLVMMEHFEAEEALRLIERERITVAGVVPTMLSAMLRHPNRHKYDISSMRVWVCAAGTPPFDLVKELEETVGGKVIQFYGAVDWGSAVNSTLEDPIEVRVLTAGKPVWGARIKIVDDEGKELPDGEVGEVWGTGPACVGGYYKDLQATREAWTEDGWYRTGDLGKINEAGNLVIVGRKKEMIKRGGQNIYPIEIEKLLITHPKVADAAVVGMPDPEMLERACAYVVPKSGQKFTFEEMVTFLKEKGLAPFKIPERLEILEKMPMLAADQKIDKKVLKADILEKLKTNTCR